MTKLYQPKKFTSWINRSNYMFFGLDYGCTDLVPIA